MSQNVGGIDRIARILVGLALIAAGIWGGLGWWGAIGAVPLLTALVGYCPAYSLFGLSTCPLAKRA